MNALITGACGFVGKHLCRELEDNGYILSTADIAGNPDHLLDLTDHDAVIAHFASHKYDVVFHLAGFAAVGKSWDMPWRTLELNIKPTLNLIEAVAEYSPATRLLVIGSSDEYGMLPKGTTCVSEVTSLNPQSPYAISKVAQESMALAMAKKQKVNVVITRSFNHFGPGQAPGFAVSDFSKAIADIMNGSDPVMSVGNLSAQRDFLDVRDVVRAYRLLAQKGRSGEVYNVGSGIPRSIQFMLDSLIALSGVAIEVTIDQNKLRPVDMPIVVCDNTKLCTDTGWTPVIPIEQSLQDTLEWYKHNA